MTMTNTQLLKCHDKRLLTGREGQRRYCLEMSLVPMTCPSCGKGVSSVEASGKALDDFPVGEAKDDGFNCVHCKSALHYCVPLFGNPFWILESAWQGRGA